MRRIIERVVTVVTTTTWTISWKEDPLPTEGNADPAAPADATPDAAPNLPSAIEAKEVHPLKESKK
ncbi:MAG: hypothetical protein AB1607_05965 [Chloroflexota bacterium]